MQDRQRVGEGLAAARLCDADDRAAAEQRGQRALLDVGGRLKPKLGEARLQGGEQVEGGKGVHGRSFGRGLVQAIGQTIAAVADPSARARGVAVAAIVVDVDVDVVVDVVGSAAARVRRDLNLRLLRPAAQPTLDGPGHRGLVDAVKRSPRDTDPTIPAHDRKDIDALDDGAATFLCGPVPLARLDVGGARQLRATQRERLAGERALPLARRRRRQARRQQAPFAAHRA